uniref:Uncharacterized protein n=1 Tax=Entomoneis paludosa TaxID=265537 RepID=A0A7S2YPS8_9STRA|mmetsp:Transcript_4628/g.9861  ORF Transcript_4628/g.9861 Transcript_4628/m.9861 type:complete len:725 (+) Transcript_4628:89-2263(+)
MNNMHSTMNVDRLPKRVIFVLISGILCSTNGRTMSVSSSRGVRREMRYGSSGIRQNARHDQRELSEGLFGILVDAFVDATPESANTHADVKQCRHPDTGETIHLDDPCGKSSEGKGKGKGKGTKSTATCAPTVDHAPYPTQTPTMITELPTTSRPTSYPSLHPTKTYTNHPTKYGHKGKVTKASPSPQPKEQKAEEKKESSTPKKEEDEAKIKTTKTPGPAKGGKGKTSAHGKGGKGKDSKDDDHELPVCNPAQLGYPTTTPHPASPEHPSHPSYPSSPNSSPAYQPSPNTSPNESPPSPNSSPATSPDSAPSRPSPDYCADIAAGTSDTGSNSLNFNLELVLFSAGSPDSDKFQIFLQRFVAPKSVGCPVDLENVLSVLSNRRILVGNEDVDSIDVGDFNTYVLNIGNNCGEPAPSASDNCVSGAYPISATSDDSSALEGFEGEFEQALQDSLTDDVMSALGLSGVGGVGSEVTSTGNTNTDNDGEDSGGSNSVSAIQSSDPRSAELAVGPIIAIVLAGVALFAIIILAVNRSFQPSIAKALKHRQLEEDDLDDGTRLLDDKSEDRSYFADELSVSSRSQENASFAPSPAVANADAESIMTPATRSVHRIAHVLGDADDSTFAGNSWQGSRDKSGPLFSAPVDNKGFPAAIQIAENGEPVVFDPSNFHPPNETCSSPQCQQCEQKRQQSNVRFIPVSRSYTEASKANRMLAERNYIADDTVDL